VVLPIGTTVTWRRGSEVVEGTVRAVHPRPVVRRVNQVRVKRLGTVEDPAYEIEQPDGSMTLKLHSEVEPGR
jgi:Hypervirulence associated proteins TUDOR domain